MKKLDLKTLKTVSGGHGSQQGLAVGLNLGGLSVGVGLGLGSSSGKSR
ncbi:MULTISPECIES: hypothetical protein [Methylobacterium]|jgi:hypothetical protein|uniref:Uncharacterized protein n=2 Tax=Methylobacterium TaxID=407 RepID=A0AAE8HVD3_9HYPH|nr:MULTISPECIES: hypothetical protein [Methylobacterium]APT34671.1 hypothetical protein MCBMB27_05380 [Methylobacterium phyllosphaerae]MBA9064399.1 hypothetical protein [Methylobacterium fujisawaense]MDE4909362.1 hypothetical protein [Methylobacterium sp. 092160098-2]MDH3027242.1 hypothetical protein [Methylobacterium fujisawaense]WFS08204.1 hypothetical protein P9K36_02570 [Methylobacterium sp. 391_Methyba4]